MKLNWFILLLCPSVLSAQSPAHAESNKNSPGYFQQEVNYKIAVALDDKTNTLTGNIEIEYINNSPDALPQIWMHLWGNAFKNRQTAFCRQKLRDGSSEFYFADDKDLGFYKNLAFTADGQKIDWKYDAKNPDIAILTLPKPLAPGSRITLATPFLLKIPASFSRLGHVGTSYQMTQWYPKPAVYDHKGWHAMPYLDQGEFYSEFGSFDVSISLPENYVVGATGVLQTPAEIVFLDKRVEETKAEFAKGVKKKKDVFPDSSPNMKTIRYTADLVHDFAWFADKRFWVIRDTARLASGRSVDCWAFFTNKEAALWQKGAFYVRRAVEFYSEKVGEYPYPQATAVHSALSAGGGMEYPMITVIGNSGSAKELDDVITHEVGHNWFYGILASNERDHPFMDEGLNSYYEHRYMRQYYADYSPIELPKKLYDPEDSGDILNNGYLMLARDRKDTPPDTHSDDFTPIAYGLQTYMKTALCLRWLEKSVGTDKFDAAMQAYYRKWQFRHPYPEDLKKVFQENNLDSQWFFESMQTKKRTDDALKKVKSTGEGKWQLTVQRKGDLQSPFAITALKDGMAVKSEWHQGIEGAANTRPTKIFEVTAPEADAFVIDHEQFTLDLNRKNNIRRTSGLFPGTEPISLKMPVIFQKTNRNTLGIINWVGWNNADKTMIGFLLYNPPLPPRKLQVYLLPGYAIGSKSWVGLADLRYRFFPGGFFQKMIAGVGLKTFNVDYNPQNKYYTRFYRIAPQVRAELRSGNQAYRHALNVRTLFIGEEAAAFDTSGVYLGKNWENKTIPELRYEGEFKSLPNPFRFQIALETQSYRDAFDNPASYLRGTVEWRQQLYFKPKRKITARFFAGYFLQNTRRHNDINKPYHALSLNPQGFNDYKYDQIFLARSGGAGFAGRQVSQTEGGFKGAFGAAYANVIGNSNNFIVALNLKSDLPKRLPFGIPIKPYFDIGYFDDASRLGEGRPGSEQLLWSGGLMFELFKGGFEVYFPLFNSETLKRQYREQAGGTDDSKIFGGGEYRKMISWSLRINTADPLELIQNLVR